MPIRYAHNWDGVDQVVAEAETKGETVVQIIEVPRGVAIVTTKGPKFETRIRPEKR